MRCPSTHRDGVDQCDLYIVHYGRHYDPTTGEYWQDEEED